uniref:Uncharacterized protein n=1 Tax=Setaria viridis TaxID=4556 RepID=A0A4U6WFM4_SETVI|nr:hypothetical protein SEVIR_1G319950v2 [Setaria viridis]
MEKRWGVAGRRRKVKRGGGVATIAASRAAMASFVFYF